MRTNKKEAETAASGTQVEFKELFTIERNINYKAGLYS